MKNKLSSAQKQELLNTLKTRFEKNMNRHKGIEWSKVEAKLDSPAGEKKLWSLYEMERTGGEPDIVGYDKKSDKYIFYDCTSETPICRRSIFYNHEALKSRKQHKPKDSAIKMAEKMGIDLLSEDEYREVQNVGAFD